MDSAQETTAEELKPEELVAIRKAMHLTQQGLGDEIGVTKQTIYRWEAGEVHISPRAARHIRLLAGQRQASMAPARAKKSA